MEHGNDGGSRGVGPGSTGEIGGALDFVGEIGCRKVDLEGQGRIATEDSRAVVEQTGADSWECIRACDGVAGAQEIFQKGIQSVAIAICIGVAGECRRIAAAGCSTDRDAGSSAEWIGVVRCGFWSD